MSLLRHFRNLFLVAVTLAVAGLLLAGGTFSHSDATHDHEHTADTQTADHDHEHSGPLDITANATGDIHCGADILADVFTNCGGGNQILNTYHPECAEAFQWQVSYIEPPPPKRLS